jgi:PAP2 superfamily
MGFGHRDDPIVGQARSGGTLLAEREPRPVEERRRRRRLMPLLPHLLLVAAAYAFYAWIRGQVGSETNPADLRRAVRNGERVVGWERALGLFHEHTVQQWALRAPWLVRALDSFWSYGYLVVTATVIVWLLGRHVTLFSSLGTALFAATLAALAIFALMPTAPPRLLPRSYGIIDTWARLGGIHAAKPPRIEHISDPFASIPSLHVAWAVWCAAAVTKVTARRGIRLAAWIYVLLTVLAVVATGNHYILDCLAGAFLMAAALWWSPFAVGAVAAVRFRSSKLRALRGDDGGATPDYVG